MTSESLRFQGFLEKFLTARISNGFSQFYYDCLEHLFCRQLTKSNDYLTGHQFDSSKVVYYLNFPVVLFYDQSSVD